MIRVLVVDDSPLIRRVLAERLSVHPEIEVVATACDPFEAREQIIVHHPDVLTLDVEMPKMDGITFLERLMQHYPMPVVMVSSLTPRHSQLAIRALALGAVEVICKDGSPNSAPTASIAAAILRAGKARVRASLTEAGPPQIAPAEKSTAQLFAIGASTGGPSAVECVLRSLPVDAPPTVVVQHMPENFTEPFAERLNSISAVEVREAVDRLPLVPGAAWIAPGGKHLSVEHRYGRLFLRIDQAPPVNFHRPSVDLLFESVAEAAQGPVVAALLTGMGNDGARGMLELRSRGAHTIAQDEDSSVVYGMPKAAVGLDAACEILPIKTIGPAMLCARSGALRSA